MPLAHPLSSAALAAPGRETACLTLAPPPAPADEHQLARAFAGFAAAAATLESSYTQLQAEVAGLRHELEDRNCALAQSLEEKRTLSQHLDRILEGLPCGVLVIEADQRLSVANPEARRLLAALGGDRGESVEAALPGVRQLIAEARPGAAEGQEREYRCARACAKEGNGAESAPAEEQWIAARLARVTTAAGVSSVLILRDITAAKQLAGEREQARCRQALAEMSGLLAHEMRNPLGSLELFAGLLAGSHLDDESRKWAEQMQAGLRLLAATVNNVLHFHSPSTPALAPLDLGNLLTWLEQFLRPLAQQAGVTLDLGHQLAGVEVAGDRHRLEQVLLNLALNAFRFMPGGGRLRIAGRVHEGGREGLRESGREGENRRRATVELTDTGCGITAENRRRIFTPGFTTRAGSPGLGLAVCRTIMQQHGGGIAVSSRLGHGSRFVLDFPLSGGRRDQATETTGTGQ